MLASTSGSEPRDAQPPTDGPVSSALPLGSIGDHQTSCRGRHSLPRREPQLRHGAARILRDQLCRGLSTVAGLRKGDGAGTDAVGAVRTDQDGGGSVGTVDEVERRDTSDGHRDGTGAVRAQPPADDRGGGCPCRRPTCTTCGPRSTAPTWIGGDETRGPLVVPGSLIPIHPGSPDGRRPERRRDPGRMSSLDTDRIPLRKGIERRPPGIRRKSRTGPWTEDTQSGPVATSGPASPPEAATASRSR